jgi:hypothetical protein
VRLLQDTVIRKSIEMISNPNFSLQRTLKKLPKPIVTLLVLTGTAASAFSTFFLPGWFGGSGAMTTTMVSATLFLIFCSYYFWMQFISKRYAPSLILVLISIPPFLVISYVAVMKGDLRFVSGVVVFVALLGIGRLVTQIFAPSSKSKYLAYLPVGQLAFLATYLLFQNVISMFVLTWILVVLGLSSMFFEVYRVREFFKSNVTISQEIQEKSLFYPSIVSLLLILLIGAHSPIFGFDALSMKVWLPTIWSANDSIFLPTEHLLSGVSGSFSFPVLASIELGGSSGGNALQFLSLVLGLLVVFVHLKPKSFSVSLPQMLLLLTLVGVPANIWQISSSYDDLWMMTIFLCGILFVQKNISSTSLRQTLFSSLVIGSVASAKFSLMPVVLVIVTYFAITKFLQKGLGLRRRLNFLIATSFGFLLSLLPFYGWKWVSYGNPIWPLMNNIFKAPGAPFESIKFNLPYSEMSYLDFLLSPITTVFEVSKWGEEGAPGSYNSIYSIILLSLILGIVTFFKSSQKVILVSIIAFGVSWFINFRYSRYLFYIFPVSIVAVFPFIRGPGKERVPSNVLKRALSANALMIVTGLIFAASFTIGNPANPDRIPYRYVFSAETEDNYLQQVSLNYRLVTQLNNTLPINATIVSPQLFERTWLRTDINLYHFWEANEEIARNSWKVFVTDSPAFPDQFYQCQRTKNFELYSINPPGCKRSS